jgi:hypothetical protein
MQISRIRLSDKTSRLHPRHVVPKPAQAYEPEVPVEVREWISPALASPDLVPVSDLAAAYRQAGIYAGKILSGASAVAHQAAGSHTVALKIDRWRRIASGQPNAAPPRRLHPLSPSYGARG